MFVKSFNNVLHKKCSKTSLIAKLGTQGDLKLMLINIILGGENNIEKANGKRYDNQHHGNANAFEYSIPNPG